MSSEKHTVKIEPVTIGIMDAMLSDFYRERALIASQMATNIQRELVETTKKLDSANEAIATMSQPEDGEDDDRALAALVREWFSHDIRTQSLTDSLARDVGRILERNDE